MVLVTVRGKGGAAVTLLAAPASYLRTACGPWLFPRAFRQRAKTSALGNVRFSGGPPGRVLVRATTSESKAEATATVAGGEYQLTLALPRSMPFQFIRTGFLLLSLGLAAAPAKDPANPPKVSDWNRVHALSPGVITRVKIHKNEAPKGERSIKGFFSSSTDNSITVLFRDGTTRTIEKRVVSTVRVRRPTRKRYTLWAIGITTAVITGYLYGQPRSDYTLLFKFLMPALSWAPIARCFRRRPDCKSPYSGTPRRG